MNRVTSALRLVLGFALIGCGDDGPSAPEGGDPGITIVAGDAQSDSIGAILTRGLVVEVRDSAGRPLSDVLVSFEADGVLVREAGTDEFRSGLFASSNNEGRAVVQVRMGGVSGAASIEIVVPEFGFTRTASFTVEAGAAVRVSVSPADTARLVGGRYTLATVAIDRLGNAVHSSVGGDADFEVISGPATVSEAGVVTAGSSVGRAAIRVSLGSDTHTAWLSVVPGGTITATDQLGANTPALVQFRTDGEQFTVLAASVSNWVELSSTASPVDGRIAFQKDWPATRIVEVGAIDDPIVAGETPSFQSWAQYTADGQHLVFAGRDAGSYAVWMVDADGGLPTQLWPTADEIVSPSLSPTRGTLAYVERNLGSLVLVGLAGDSVLARVDGATIARFSPTDDLVAMVRDGNIWVVNADGSGLRLVAEGPSHGFTEHTFGWSPDGDWVIAHEPFAQGDWLGHLTLVRISDGLQLPLAFQDELSQSTWGP